MKLLVTTLALAASCSAQTAAYGHNEQYLLPDRSVTPGAVNPAIVADLSGKSIRIDGVEANICAKGFSTDPYKKTTEPMKHQICEEYGQQDCPDPEKGAIDRLIPLEIGGEDAVNNLWWRPEPDDHAKDQVGDKLKSLVCSGKITLKFAQSCVQHNWVNCMWIAQSLEKCDKCTVTVAPAIKVPR